MARMKNIERRKSRGGKSPKTWVTQAANRRRQKSAINSKKNQLSPDITDQIVKPGATTTKVKKPHRYKPGTVSLRETREKNDVPDSILHDPDFKPRINMEFVEDKMKTRYDCKPFKKIADNLPVLEDNHSLSDEQKQYWKFLENVASETKYRRNGYTDFLESEHGIWCCTMVRYTGMQMRGLTLRQRKRDLLDEGEGAEKINDELNFWKTRVGSAHTVVKDVNPLLSSNKPICFLLGSKNKSSNVGHCLTLVVHKTIAGIKAYVKESLPKTQDPKRCIFKFLEIFKKAETVDVVYELSADSNVTYTECLKESYRVVGNVLDGIYFWKKDLTFSDPYARYTYKVSTKKLPKPKKQKDKSAK